MFKLQYLADKFYYILVQANKQQIYYRLKKPTKGKMVTVYDK